MSDTLLGEHYLLWRAVDKHGACLDIPLQKCQSNREREPRMGKSSGSPRAILILVIC